MKKIWKNSRVKLIGTFVTLLMLFYWAWLFYMTQSATEANTYKRCETIIDVEIRLASHRGSDKLYIISQNQCYMLDTGWRNKDKSYELAENLIFGGQDCTITIWKHIPKSLFDIRENSVQVYQVVDLRNDSVIYWDIESHNNYQKTERIAGIIAGAFFSVLAVAFVILCLLSRSR